MTRSSGALVRRRLAQLEPAQALTLVIGNKAYSSWSLRPWLLLAYVTAVAAHPAVQAWIAAARTEPEVIASSEVGEPDEPPPRQ